MDRLSAAFPLSALIGVLFDVCRYSVASIIAPTDYLWNFNGTIWRAFFPLFTFKKKIRIIGFKKENYYESNIYLGGARSGKVGLPKMKL